MKYPLPLLFRELTNKSERNKTYNEATRLKLGVHENDAANVVQTLLNKPVLPEG